MVWSVDTMENIKWGWEVAEGAGDEAEKVPKVQEIRLRRYLRCRRRGQEVAIGAGDKSTE